MKAAQQKFKVMEEMKGELNANMKHELRKEVKAGQEEMKAAQGTKEN